VILEVRDASGNRATDVLLIEVRDTTSPVANAGPDRQVLVLQEVTIDGSASSDNVGVVSWWWEVQPWNGSFIFMTPCINITFNETGTYKVKLTVRDAVGNSGTCMVNLTVVDLERPVAEAGPDQILHDKGKVRLDASASTDNVGIVNYTWSLSYGGVPRQGYGRVAEILLDEPGSYMITLSVRDRAGNVAEDSLNVTVEIVEPEVPRFHLPSSAWMLIVLIVVVVSSALVWTGWRLASSRKTREP
jgi:hypothetical protein